MRRLLAIWLCVLCCAVCVAQETILIGDIVNEQTGEPIAGANIYYQGTHIGTASDEQGSFMLRTDLSRKRTLVISAVGYHTQRYPIEPGTMAGIQVALREKTSLIEEVVATPGENPALPLIAAVRNARPQNDRMLHTEQTTSADSRTELYISHIQKRHLERQLWRSLQTGLLTGEDSTLLLPLYRSQQSILLQGTDLHPTSEKQQKALVLTADDYSILLQTQGNLNFYHNSLSLLGHSFLSPLATSGATYYRYYLIDSVQTIHGKTYIIDFRTRNPFYATFNGSLHIDSSTYAILSIDATVPAQTSVNYLSNLQIHQRFAPDHSLQSEEITTLLDFAVKTDTTHLFPTVLLRQSIQADTPVIATDSTAYAALYPSASSVESAEAAFAALDSVPLIRTAKWVAGIITTGYISTGTCVDIGHIEEILQVNQHESVHLGFPLRTNEKLWRNVSLEASVGYGFRDQAWKGMGRVNINLPTLRRNTLQMEYQDHYVWSEVDDFSRLLRENSMGWKNMDFTAYAFEALRSNPYTHNTAARQRQIEIRTENDWTDNIETTLYGRVGWMGYGNPLVGYKAMPCYRYQSLGGILRVGFKERKVDMYFRRVHVYSRYPVLYVGLETGSWQTDEMAHYRMYGRLNLLVRQQVSLGMGGSLDWALSAGIVLGKVPYPMLHHFEGNQGYAYDPYRFTLMNNLQYAADRYLSLHAEWNGQGILFNLIPGIRYLRLRELVSFKLAYGYLSDTNSIAHADWAKTALPALTGTDIPYVEMGVGIGNILRIGDLYSVWRLTNRQDPTTPRWAMRFRIHIGL